MTGKDETRIEDMMSELRDLINSTGDVEINLTDNPYGFVTAWLEGEDNEEVWWDKNENSFPMGELAELTALRDTIEQTLECIKEQR